MPAALAEISYLFMPYLDYNVSDLIGSIMGVVLSVPVY